MVAKVKKTKKAKRMTIKEAKMEASRLGLIVAKDYDKRFINTWLYTIGDTTVEPVLRTSIVHKPKKVKKTLSWADLASLSEA